MYLVFGRSVDGWSGEIDALAQADVLIAGASDAVSLANAGDLNNDGFDDLVILESGVAAHVLYGRSDTDWTDQTTLQPSADGFTAAGDLWHVTDRRGADPGHSAEHSFYFGDDATGDYSNGGAAAAGTLTSPLIDLTSAASATLTFNYFLETEGNGAQFDQAIVSVSAAGGDYEAVASNTGGAGHSVLVDPSGDDEFLTLSVDLSAYLGQQIRIRFSFDTIDAQENTAEGFYVDDVVVTTDAGDLLSADFSVRRLDLGDADIAIAGSYAAATGLGDVTGDNADDLALLAADEARLYFGDPGGSFNGVVDLVLDHGPGLAGFESRATSGMSTPMASGTLPSAARAAPSLSAASTLLATMILRMWRSPCRINSPSRRVMWMAMVATMSASSPWRRRSAWWKTGRSWLMRLASLFLDVDLGAADPFAQPAIVVEAARPVYADADSVDPAAQPAAFDALMYTLRIGSTGDVNGDGQADAALAESLGSEVHLILGEALTALRSRSG